MIIGLSVLFLIFLCTFLCCYARRQRQKKENERNGNNNEIGQGTRGDDFAVVGFNDGFEA